MSSGKITALYAFLSGDDDDGSEGIVAYRGENEWMPLVTSNKALLPQMEMIAREISEESGVDIYLAIFRRIDSNKTN